MKIENFINSAFHKIQLALPITKLAYQYNSYSNTHFVKVTPPEVYDMEAFINLDFELTGQFEKIEPKDTLCFITEGSLVDLDNPSIVFQPKTILNNIPLRIKADFLMQASLGNFFRVKGLNDESKEKLTSFSFSSMTTESMAAQLSSNINLLEAMAQSKLTNTLIYSDDLENVESNSLAGNSKYAMAA